MSSALDLAVESVVERTIKKLLPHIVAPRPEWTTKANAKRLFEKTFRAIDEWARRRALTRYSIAGTPAYRTADLDAAIVASGRAPSAPAKDDAEEEYERLVSGAAQ